jgi:hypothetical protein
VKLIDIDKRERSDHVFLRRLDMFFEHLN